MSSVTSRHRTRRLAVIDYQPSQFAGARWIDRGLLVVSIVATPTTSMAWSAGRLRVRRRAREVEDEWADGEVVQHLMATQWSIGCPRSGRLIIGE
jgi:hypothetical protein